MEPTTYIKTPLEEQFNDKVGLYHEVLTMTAEVDNAHTRKVIKDTYKELKQFVKEHPEFADRLPAIRELATGHHGASRYFESPAYRLVQPIQSRKV